LPERPAGRVDDRLAAFAEHMRGGLLAASTAVGLEVMAELMDAEVAELVGPRVAMTCAHGDAAWYRARQRDTRGSPGAGVPSPRAHHRRG
jgi:hypothetical protein